MNIVLQWCFNPCFNGSWSESSILIQFLSVYPVSILVLMEVGLRVSL